MENSMEKELILDQQELKERENGLKESALNGKLVI
jgi:hypothetical protein